MKIDEVLRDGPDTPQRLLRRVTGHVGRQRYQRDREEHRESAAFQILAFLQQREKEQANADNRADGREVIEQQMSVDEVCRRQHQVTAPRASTAYAMSRPEVITASQSTRHASAVLRIDGGIVPSVSVVSTNRRSRDIAA